MRFFLGYPVDEGTTDAIFIVRLMQEKFRAKGKKLYFGFVYLVKAFDRVLREQFIDSNSFESLYEDKDNVQHEDTGRSDKEQAMPILLDEVRDAIWRLPRGKAA